MYSSVPIFVLTRAVRITFPFDGQLLILKYIYTITLYNSLTQVVCVIFSLSRKFESRKCSVSLPYHGSILVLYQPDQGSDAKKV